MKSDDWLEAEQVAAELERATAARDLRQIGRLAYIAQRQGYDELRRECTRADLRLRDLITAELAAADYPPAPMADAWRCFECWHYHQRRDWKYRRADRYGPRTPAAVAIPDDCEAGGVRVVDELIRAPVAVWRCDHGHEDFDGY